ncbi:Fic family protein [Terribacillus saccharophilus]|uniref:Fic family protein n=1 Tax=Terribacillus saccharophilus TaxID=361277 RepID=UPI002989C096|nr:Fic family protein [Terribacillus saccharophilus]MCM3227536.1 Fic family protein [Terribacillus saccharophilus]
MLKFTEEYLEDILVRLAYHSSAIEGNTITLPETVDIIIHKKLPGRQATTREFFEIANHRQAFEYMIHEINNDTPLSINVVKDIHGHLTAKLQTDSGLFKKDENAILGAEFQTASPQQTPMLMQQWVDNLNFRLNMAKDNNEEKLSTIAEFHINFERIHPFSDGNGRTGRMLMNYSLIQNNLPPLVINKEKKSEYIRCLAEQDVEGLTNFIRGNVREEIGRIQSFANKEKYQVNDQELER